AIGAVFFFSSRRRHTSSKRDWSSDVCSSDLPRALWHRGGHRRQLATCCRRSEPHARLLSESLRLAREHGSTVTLDGDFGRDLEEIINSHREPLSPPAWD